MQVQYEWFTKKEIFSLAHIPPVQGQAPADMIYIYFEGNDFMRTHIEQHNEAIVLSKEPPRHYRRHFTEEGLQFRCGHCSDKVRGAKW